MRSESWNRAEISEIFENLVKHLDLFIDFLLDLYKIAC